MEIAMLYYIWLVGIAGLMLGMSCLFLTRRKFDLKLARLVKSNLSLSNQLEASAKSELHLAIACPAGIAFITLLMLIPVS